jgi:uncharacterized protein (DUF2164 family)
MNFKLSPETRESAIASIRRYAEENLEEPLGNLAAGSILDFFLEEIGPSVYNKGVVDVQESMQARVTDLDIEINEDEFQYSRKHGWRK